MRWITLTKEEEVIAEGAKVIEFEDARIALFYAEGKIYAIDDRCPHVGASLACGHVKGLVVDCPWHHARFSLTTGANLGPPDFGPVRAYKTRTVDGNVEIAWPS